MTKTKRLTFYLGIYDGVVPVHWLLSVGRSGGSQLGVGDVTTVLEKMMTENITERL